MFRRERKHIILNKDIRESLKAEVTCLRTILTIWFSLACNKNIGARMARIQDSNIRFVYKAGSAYVFGLQITRIN